jgi:imidazolonepropionase-like amidohydrolase
MTEYFQVENYFDGEAYFNKGPYTIVVENDKIKDINKGNLEGNGIDSNANNVYKFSFLMPGLVEAHCHIFLEGGELDVKKRSAYLKSDRENMLEICRKNVRRNIVHGISLIRDAGDIHGLNHQIRAELQGSDAYQPVMRSPGTAIRKTKRYGSFMAREVNDVQDIKSLILETSPNIDDLKVLITGIIDFEEGCVKGKPQFSIEELSAISSLSNDLNIQTFAHCSGKDGIELAINSGMDSIEHGFFIELNYLEQMVEKNISWVPTYSPVHIQWARPELCQWSDDAVGKLRMILDNHLKYIKKANELGVSLIAGSDAGSYGVEHGKALLDELYFFKQAGLSTLDVLSTATVEPRKKWNCEDVRIKKNHKVDFLFLEESPFEDLENLEKVEALYNGKWLKFIET